MDSENLLTDADPQEQVRAQPPPPPKKGVYSDERRLAGETWLEFAYRHYYNFMHFFFEDWFMSAALALITVFISIFMDVFLEYILHFRRMFYEFGKQFNDPVACVCWVSFMTAAVWFASSFCYLVSKQAVGSGIPEMKVIIQGFKLKNYLSLRTCIAKIVGLTVALGAGMPTGKEGPFVHIGAIVAELLRKATRDCHFNDFFTNEGRKLELLSTGCAVGIACTFSSPAGAVLYGIESTSKYFAVKNYWRQFFATTCAALIFRFAINTMVPTHMVGTIVAYYQTSFPNEVFVIEELPLFVLIGIVSGLAGALWIWLHRRIALFRKKNKLYSSIFGGRPILFTVAMAALFSLLTFPDWSGKYIAGQYVFRETLADFISNCTFSVSNSSIGCPESILSHWTTGTENPLYSVAIYGISYYLILTLFVSLYYPAGIFVPAFVVGASGGRILGEIIANIFPEGIRGLDGPLIYPGLYAVVGAASFTGSVTRSLSVALIVCETTGQLCGLLPVLIALMVGNAIASFLQPSFYESLITINNYPYLTELPPSRISVHTMKVENVMVRNVIYISSDMTYRDLHELLLRTPYLRAYPVVTDRYSMHLLGSVGRKYLSYLLHSKFGENPSFSKKRPSVSETFMTLSRRRAEQMERNMTQGSLMADRGNSLLATSPLHEDGVSMPFRQEVPETLDVSHHASVLAGKINIDEFAIDSAPFQLIRNTSLYKVHTLFSLLALNHAYVTERGRLVGVVSVKELRETLNHIYLKGVIPLDRLQQNHNRATDETTARESETRILMESHS
ncbi:unnamed protein product [Auanema sp. JU1783]|nr:unnamed protein product [Auanema sp. JU1783]